TPDDFEVMTIKVSVLSSLNAIDVASYSELLAAVQPGVDGLVIEAGAHRATLLPSVWEQCGDASQFLDALWDKAGLAAFSWPRDTRVERYTTEEFASYGPRALTTA
ncbi:MAG TPA: AMMECR1 domain-containing protein, partial [Acidimicrobiia bacterium]